MSTEETKIKKEKKPLTAEKKLVLKKRHVRKVAEKKKAKSDGPKKVEKQRKTKSKDEVYKNIFQARPKNWGIGNDPIHKLDLTRFVKWPKYVRLQRQRRILYKRLRVPPSINQFNHTLSKQLALRLFKFLGKYRPEDKKSKQKRLRAAADAKKKGEKPVEVKKGPVVHFGLSEVVGLIERKKATLVIIAHDVEPIEQVIFLPALCKKMNVPYCVVKGRARLGAVVHQKTSAVLALTEVLKEDKTDYDTLVQSISSLFNEKFNEINRKWGGVELSVRSQRAQGIKKDK
jgi:large subunit ribosomal protein L7Ae